MEPNKNKDFQFQLPVMRDLMMSDQNCPHMWQQLKKSFADRPLETVIGALPEALALAVVISYTEIATRINEVLKKVLN